MRAAYKQVFLGQAVKPHKRAGGWCCKSQRRETILVPNACLESQHSEQLFGSKVAEVVPGWPDDHGRPSTMGPPGGPRNGRQADVGAWNRRPWSWAEGLLISAGVAQVRGCRQSLHDLHVSDALAYFEGRFPTHKAISCRHLNSVQHEAVFLGACRPTAEKMLTADRWVQCSSHVWVSVVVGSHYSVCYTVLVPRIAQPMICWTCSVPSSGSLWETMGVGSLRTPILHTRSCWTWHEVVPLHTYLRRNCPAEPELCVARPFSP